jgi:hypothetical protein
MARWLDDIRNTTAGANRRTGPEQKPELAGPPKSRARTPIVKTEAAASLSHYKSRLAQNRI